MSAFSIHAFIDCARVQVVTGLKLMIALTIEADFHGTGIVVHALNAQTRQTNDITNVRRSQTG